LFVLSVEIAALYISVIEERRHLKLPDFTLFKNELLPFRQNCVMVLIKNQEKPFLCNKNSLLRGKCWFGRRVR
jgi:hypothetical protein